MDDFQASLRAQRRRLAIVAIAAPLAIGAAMIVVLALREREVVLVGGAQEVSGRIEGRRFLRLSAPDAASIRLGAGVHPITDGQGPVRASIVVPYTPWIAAVAAPVEEGQCLIVASGNGFYGDGPTTVFVHAWTTESREVGLPPLFSDRVFSDPCRLPRAMPLLETMAIVYSVPCTSAPRDENAARQVILDRWRSCGGT